VADARLIKETVCDACGNMLEVIDPRGVLRWEVGWVTYRCPNCGHIMRVRYVSGGVDEKSR
jgi:RNase P subunit RPR2